MTKVIPRPISFFDGAVLLHDGDCLDVLETMDENSIDSIVVDPPYHLTSGKKGGTGAASLNLKSPAGRSRIGTGFTGRKWDGGDIAFRPDVWIKVLRVLKPGGYIVAFGGARTWHRMACAIEDAGFITHPMLGWVTGQGFEKGHSVSKELDRAAGAQRKVVGKKRNNKGDTGMPQDAVCYALNQSKFSDVTEPATDEARQWEGWYYGIQSMKPSLEPIYFGQKPFSEKTGALNILKWGTGAINVDGCRIHSADSPARLYTVKRLKPGADLLKTGGNWRPEEGAEYHGETKSGRWPANLIHDGSPEVLACFPETTSGVLKAGTIRNHENQIYGKGLSPAGIAATNHDTGGDSGSAARFFAS